MEMRNETILNLARSFAGESLARTRYTVYAQIARKEGYDLYCAAADLRVNGDGSPEDTAERIEKEWTI